MKPLLNKASNYSRIVNSENGQTLSNSSTLFKICVMLVSAVAVFLLMLNLVRIPQTFSFKDKYGRMAMGNVNPDCDDGKRHLDVDWSGDERDKTCGADEEVASLGGKDKQNVNCISIPEDYFPLHYCMKDKITYEEFNRIPRYGPHRPVWPIFGEYKYVPVQRWLHNIEHGSVVLLYHPCVNKTQLDTVRNIVTGCIRKHIITPSRLVLHSAPIALVAWGCSLEMTSMDRELIIRFIKQKGLHGPEGHLPKQGQYDHLLIHAAKPPPGSDINDTVLCPPQQQSNKSM